MRKRHPMQMAKAGDLFAVQIQPNVWGYCRAWRGVGIEIPPVFTKKPGIPVTRWAPERKPPWLFRLNLITEDIDWPLFLPVGKVPFASAEDAVMPATFRDPDNIEPRYTIEDRGVYKYTSNVSDLKGIAKETWLVPATLGEFLKQKYKDGKLREVELQRDMTESP